MAYRPYDPFKKPTAVQPQQGSLAIAPPPPLPPPTPAPTLQQPPNAIRQPEDMDIKRQKMGLIATPETQATATPPVQNTAIQPNTAPPPVAPMPNVAASVSTQPVAPDFQTTPSAPVAQTAGEPARPGGLPADAYWNAEVGKWM